MTCSNCRSTRDASIMSLAAASRSGSGACALAGTASHASARKAKARMPARSCICYSFCRAAAGSAVVAVGVAVQHRNTIRSGNDGGVGDAEEQTAFDDPWYQLQRILQRLGIGNLAECAIEDEVAAVGLERPPFRGDSQLDLTLAASIGGQHLDHVAGGGQAEANHLNGQRKP